MIRLLAIGGNHSRHLYVFNEIHKKFPLAGFLMEGREMMLPLPPEGVPEGDRKNFIRHFQRREEAERQYFGVQAPPDCRSLAIKTEELNTEKSTAFVRDIRPDIVLIFGCDLIKGPLYAALPKHSVNLHLGISPRYRGSATLFWPFYYLDPLAAGVTFHYIIAEPDAGKVIHQSTPELNMTDGIHDVACKAVLQATRDAIKLLEIFEQKGRWDVFRQTATGKNFMTADFKPHHLRVIYDLFNDDIVRHCLQGDLQCHPPKLIRQF